MRLVIVMCPKRKRGLGGVGRVYLCLAFLVRPVGGDRMASLRRRKGQKGD